MERSLRTAPDRRADEPASDALAYWYEQEGLSAADLHGPQHADDDGAPPAGRAMGGGPSGGTAPRDFAEILSGHSRFPAGWWLLPAVLSGGALWAVILAALLT